MGENAVAGNQNGQEVLAMINQDLDDLESRSEADRRAIQMAKAVGAIVVTTSSQRNFQLIEKLGLSLF